jgi:5'-nucleotidase
MKRKDVLFDMDGCKVDFVGGILDFLKQCYPDIQLSREDLNHWDIFDFIHCEVARSSAIQYMQSPDFFLNLKPIPKAVEAFEALVALGHNVRVCTTPLPASWPVGRIHSIRAKSLWVRRVLGVKAAQNMIFAEDKTIHAADVIIDDKPTLTFGKTAIQFDHWLIVDHPYNRILPKASHLPCGRINNDWSNWQDEFAKVELI